MSELAGLGFSHTAAMDALQQCKGNKGKGLGQVDCLGRNCVVVSRWDAMPMLSLLCNSTSAHAHALWPAMSARACGDLDLH